MPTARLDVPPGRDVDTLRRLGALPPERTAVPIPTKALQTPSPTGPVLVRLDPGQLRRDRRPHLGGICPKRLSGRQSSQHPRRFPPRSTNWRTLSTDARTDSQESWDRNTDPPRRQNRQPPVAVCPPVHGEMAAVVLTVRKTSDDPTSETASTWLLDGAGVAAIAAVHDFTDLNELLYPIHHILANLAVVVAIVAGWHAAANRTVLIRV